MDARKREQIIQLRTHGMGYKSIASKLGLSRDAVRYFCQKNNITGKPDIAKLNYETMQQNDEICCNCGGAMKQSERGRKKKFCSDKCRSDWWNKNYMLHNFGKDAVHKFCCKGCGKEFISYSNKNRKYCSHECYINHRFKKEVERHD